MLEIGIEIGDLLRPHRAGMARYTECLLGGLMDQADPNSLSAWAPWRRWVGWHWKPPGISLRLFRNAPPRSRPDVFHATACVFPAWKSRVEVATIHDLFAVQPALNLSTEEVQRRMNYAFRAERIVCVSHFTRRQVREILHIPEDRCVAIPLAVGKAFLPATELQKSELRRSLGLPQEFLLFVGRDRPNKNLDRLVAAYARARLSVPLIIAGRQSSRTKQRLLALSREHQCGGSIRWLNSLRDRDLPTLLSCATALCMPSTFEGFGLPILEAMACGTAVLTSAGQATEEAAGGQAVLIDPESIDSIADGLVRVQKVTHSQRAAARTLATQRTWSDVARETLAVYLA